MSVLPTYWLSMHVRYACRHSGACCSSGWAIPVEQGKTARIATLRSTSEWLRTATAAPPDVAGVLALQPDGHCIFHCRALAAPAAPAFCEIHRALGPAALPAACQHFPRQCLIDRRGVFVTLSHYCPTAASLLFEHSGPVEIVEGPPANPYGEAEGLDARDVLPPLLTDGVLMDLDAYSAWEAHAVRSLAGQASLAAERSPEAVLAALAADATRLMKWRPGGIMLRDAVRALERTDARRDAVIAPDWKTEMALVALVHDAIAENQRPPALPRPARELFTLDRARDWRAHAVVINRFLAAHAFASWAAYQGRGLGAMIRALRMVLAVVRCEVLRACEQTPGALSDALLKEAIRRSDLLLVHLADRGYSQEDQEDQEGGKSTGRSGRSGSG